MSIRVFISHSTWLKPELDEVLQKQIPCHLKLLEGLCSRLKDASNPDFDIVIDRDIPAGYHWREYLFEKMVECQAGIVLLNKQALFHSEWVNIEVSILGWRAITDKSNFRLIIVPFGGITEVDIAENKLWGPIALNEIQVQKRGGLDENDPAAVNRLFDDIVKTLQELPDYDEPAPSGWLVDRLCNLLPSDINILKAIGKSLNYSLNGSSSLIAIRRQIAHYIYKKGPSSIFQLVRCTSLPIAWNGEHILEILSTYWVDISASIGILSSCQCKETPNIIALNGKEVGYTPKIYVRQVCGEINTWPVFMLDSVHDLNSQIRDVLIEQFQSQLKRRPGLIDRGDIEEIDQTLNSFMSSPNDPPIFITFMLGKSEDRDSLLNEIQKVFPFIKIIICTGTKPIKSPILSAEIQMLMPEFDLDVEAREFKNYESAEKHLKH